jgi:hypothetical protein
MNLGTFLQIVNEGLVPDLLRARGKSICGDRNINEEDYEHNGHNLTITTPRLRWIPTRVHTSWPRQEA